MCHHDELPLAVVPVIGFYHTNQIPQTEPGSPTPRAFPSDTIRTVGEAEGNIKNHAAAGSTTTAQVPWGSWNKLAVKAASAGSVQAVTSIPLEARRIRRYCPLSRRRDGSYSSIPMPLANRRKGFQKEALQKGSPRCPPSDQDRTVL